MCITKKLKAAYTKAEARVKRAGAETFKAEQEAKAAVADLELCVTAMEREHKRKAELLQAKTELSGVGAISRSAIEAYQHGAPLMPPVPFTHAAMEEEEVKQKLAVWKEASAWLTERGRHDQHVAREE